MHTTQVPGNFTIAIMHLHENFWSSTWNFFQIADMIRDIAG
jgi:hypothetical protein